VNERDRRLESAIQIAGDLAVVLIENSLPGAREAVDLHRLLILSRSPEQVALMERAMLAKIAA